jgi:tetratricopeptide (TPR) repeat protein
MKNPVLGYCWLLVIGLAMVLVQINCIPPEDMTEIEKVASPTPEKQHIDRDKCDLFLNFAYSYYQNQNWRSTISNYRKMLEYGCQEEYAQDIYPFFGRAYLQLAKTADVYYDSALYVFIEGQKYLPDNMFLLENIAYIYHIQKKYDLEIREYEKMIELKPSDIALYKKYNKLCFEQNRFEDMRWGIEKILEIDPNDEQALNDQRVVFNKLGIDPTKIIREQWEKNPTNIRYGLEYAKALTDKLQYDKAIEVYKKVTAQDLRNKDAWEKLADLYKTMGRYQEAAGAYEHIAKNIDPKDLTILDDVTKMYINLADYATAYIWAKKAVSLGNSGVAYKIRADVFYMAADYYSSSRQPKSFEDKLVYKLAYDDYRKAKDLGEYGIQSRLDLLKEYLIPTREDWFMNRYDASGKERTVFRPRLDCYNWIDVNVSTD